MSLLHFNHSVLLLFSLCTPLHLLYSCHVMSVQAAGAQVPIALIIMAHQLFDMVVVTSNVHIEIIDRLSPALKSVICQLLKGTVHFTRNQSIVYAVPPTRYISSNSACTHSLYDPFYSGKQKTKRERNKNKNAEHSTAERREEYEREKEKKNDLGNIKRRGGHDGAGPGGEAIKHLSHPLVHTTQTEPACHSCQRRG